MIWTLLLIFQLKHFLADYPLQIDYMLKKFSPYPAYIKPLLAHAGVHGLFTYFIAAWFFSKHYYGIFWVIGLALFDFLAHFVVDRIKASPDLLGKFKALSAKEYPSSSPEQKISNKYFWWSLGADQFAHHITHYIIIYLIITNC